MIRTEGKYNADTSKRQFWLHYRRNVKNNMDRRVYDKVFKELFESFSQIILDGNSIKLIGIGTFRIRAFQPKLFNKHGELKKSCLRVDWKKTWDYWREHYAGKTDEEIKQIENKHLFYHTNEHSNGYIYELFWNKCVPLVGKSYYRFKTVRANNRRRKELILSKQVTYYE